MAQLGARLDGIEEVVGSNPIGSTKTLNFIFLFSLETNSFKLGLRAENLLHRGGEAAAFEMLPNLGQVEARRPKQEADCAHFVSTERVCTGSAAGVFRNRKNVAFTRIVTREAASVAL